MALLIEQYVPYIRLQRGSTSNLPWTFNGTSRFGAATALGTAATQSLDPTLDNVFTLTPTQGMTINAASVPAGQELYLVVTTSGTSSYTLTFGTGFKTTGTLATGTSSAKVFVMQFISDGTNFNEVCRTTAM